MKCPLKNVKQQHFSTICVQCNQVKPLILLLFHLRKSSHSVAGPEKNKQTDAYWWSATSCVTTSCHKLIHTCTYITECTWVGSKGSVTDPVRPVSWAIGLVRYTTITKDTQKPLVMWFTDRLIDIRSNQKWNTCGCSIIIFSSLFLCLHAQFDYTSVCVCVFHIARTAHRNPPHFKLIYILEACFRWRQSRSAAETLQL